MKKNPRFDDSFNEHFPYFAQCFPPSYFPTSSSIPSFLNNANVSKIPGQVPHHNEDFTRPNSGDEVSQSPTYLSSLQPDLAVKETFMQNSLSTPNPASNIADNDFATHGVLNQSPELWTFSEPFPLVDRVDREIDREKVVPINVSSTGSVAASSLTSDTREFAALLAALRSEIASEIASETAAMSQAMSRQIASLEAALRATQSDLQVAHACQRATQADLQVAQEQIQALKQSHQRSDDDMLQFKQQQQQALRQQAQIHWNQDQQMERRLLQGAEETVKRAFHDERERSIRGSRSAVSEPTRQPSTYSVPKRENKGIYAK
jgi:hypothetical protein